MTLKEMTIRLNDFLKTNDPDTEVLITLSDRSVGGRAAARIQGIYSGIDFEHGQLRIEPAEKIFRNINRFDHAVGTIKQEFGGVKFTACSNCWMKVSKDDLYCRHCGQRLR